MKDGKKDEFIVSKWPKEVPLTEESLLLLDKLNFKFLLNVKALCFGADLLVFLEVCDLGNTHDFLLNHGQEVDMECELKLWAAQLSCALSFLERNGIVHKEVSARRVLLFTVSHIKLAFFGHLGEKLDPFNPKWSDLCTQNDHGCFIPYEAPEVLKGALYSSKSDVWSFGVTLSVFYSHGKEPPHHGKSMEEILECVQKDASFKILAEWPKAVKQIMKKCLKFKPEERPSFKQICNRMSLHEYFKEIRNETF